MNSDPMNSDLEADDTEPELILERGQCKAAPLKAGARVGLIAPSSRPENPLALKRCVRVVEEMGFVPVVGSSVMRNTGFTAGTDEERVEDIHTILNDASIDALLCVSGGYGAVRLLPLLDFAQIRQRPRIFLGGGENDALMLAINELTGLVVFHGPNIDEIRDMHSFNSVKSALSGSAGHELSINCRDTDDAPFEGAIYSLSNKVCEGIVCGGNLTALSSLYGTRYQPKLEEKILILDDFGERNDILDRWFTTLYLATTLKEVSGIAFGSFPSCGPRGSKNMLSTEDTFGDRINEIGTPACFGFKFGLSSRNNVVPIGVSAKLDCSQGTLQILESALASDVRSFNP